ncbi:alanine--tRNA ligase [Candidatus Desantisbacteria bacterium CG2_30_40_21]|uniref:Alanine--tRNA ligase n=4 Tax=unclassified Candidatus Desantisiibacteriota TaxID=3106372 RepID=A0A2M7JDT3_9BACT|nr:MAG: alanine--tRNA ligase [Candidatus Desantisbacteria bacterium CG2_30_40_21]PIX17557.1 MAG: alanine--tRNA ligase [Candidatus Desantisbacteria bacterium CG_4_8_14_3_um_filter_40_12]PIY20355.1 MAG: alanine--tRNA ligase [Candidatus Desantisbacteria bacterium CG_4_10_14_3_um_filter_40_18]PJB29962.1 MAG: alanine--tRNA ligase [Candidatus Desantisbacteria bacterium CG_4_9_14_3_um_filter_40_11]
MKGSEIRQAYLDFFEKKGHTIKSSVSLVPDDATVLFTIAGMVPFKPLFLGQVSPLPFTRAVSSQRCLRTNDIENVGKTARHHTFFEMLGNFSFGDYFKQEAIAWAWEFLTSVVKLPADKLYATIYLDDEEAFNIWHKEIGLPENRIIKLGEDSNFWTMGETGPCGPCSEILIDQGAGIGCLKESCAPGCDCDRFLELWNLVFTQFDRDTEKTLHPLPKKNIDTGMGLERLAAVLQGKYSNFECDLLFPIIETTAEIASVSYGRDEDINIPLRIIADHLRAITFLIFDAVLPSNESRGYVLRSLIRRAIRQGRRLNLNGTFLHQLVPIVIETTGIGEVLPYCDHISKVIKQEEEKFATTLERGLNILEELIEGYKRREEGVIQGKDLFKLYDTYGFPVMLAEEIILEAGLSIDRQGFDEEMSLQRKKARAAGLGLEEKEISAGFIIEHEIQFVGYESMQSKAIVLDVIKGETLIERAEEGEVVQIVLDITPFYAESGGQSGDTGILTNEVVQIEILDTQKSTIGKTIIHQARIKQGMLKKGDTVNAQVDISSRLAIQRNHTATHLLQAALQQVLGKHVKQSGSFVSSDYLRFDFSHLSPLTGEECQRIEELVNNKIRENLLVEVSEIERSRAEKIGAMALFGEKYGQMVRVVKIGDYSLELCGGTHASATGELGLFKIKAEIGIASGVRRIEAFSGMSAYRYACRQQEINQDLSQLLKAPLDEITSRVERLIKTNKEQKKELTRLNSELIKGKIGELVNAAIKIGNIQAVIIRLDNTEQDMLRETADLLMDTMESAVIILASIVDGKVFWLAKVSQDLTNQIHAGKLIKQIAAITGGNGGGRADIAQAGGTKPEMIEEAMGEGRRMLLEMQNS